MTIYQQLTLEDRIRMGELRLQGFSVTRIAERLGRHRSTIYREFQRNFCHVWTHLRQSPKLRRKRYRSYDSRGRMAGKRHISERPKSVEGRRHRGHWEIDTVMGKGSPDCIVTLVERKTGFLMIGKLKD